MQKNFDGVRNKPVEWEDYDPNYPLAYGCYELTIEGRREPLALELHRNGWKPALPGPILRLRWVEPLP